MPRKPRLNLPGAIYHVMMRAKEGEKLFSAKSDRLFFYDLLEEGTDRFGYKVHAFCLLPDSISLVLQVGDTSISRLMQNLTFRYTRHLNQRRGRSGPLFQGRFKGVVIDADQYLLDLVGYVHNSPVRDKLAKSADAYSWSSHRAYLGKDKLPWLTTEDVLSRLAKRQDTAVKRYKAMVTAGKSEGYRPEFHWGGDDPRVLADKRFLKKALKAPAKKGKPPSVNAIVKAVCAAYDVKPAELSTPSRARLLSEARGAVGWLARETDAAPLVEIANRFNRDLSSLSRAVTRVEMLEAQDSSFSKDLRAMQKALMRK